MSVLLYFGETWAALKKHISHLAAFQMNCFRRVCGISLRDHVPNVDILKRCNTFKFSVRVSAAKQAQVARPCMQNVP